MRLFFLIPLILIRLSARLTDAFRVNLFVCTVCTVLLTNAAKFIAVKAFKHF